MFNPIFETTSQQTADLRKTHAETDQIYINTGVLAPDEVTRSRFSERGWEADIRAVDMTDVEETEEVEDLTVGGEDVEVGTAAAATAAGADVQKTALNGAQVTAAQGLLVAAANKQLPRDTVVKSLSLFFPISKAEAESVVPPDSFVPVVPEVAPAEQTFNADSEDQREDFGPNNPRWEKANPEKRAAHIAVNNALRDGKIERKNCKCGSDSVQAHHADYANKLDVTWLCKTCHDKAHGR